MKYLLDTCVLSEMTKPKPDARVVRWLASMDDAEVNISVLTLGELERGIARLTPAARKQKLAAWLNEIEAAYQGRIVDITAAVAIQWGQLSARAEQLGSKLPVVDGLLGATAVVHGLILVTRNVRDFERSGARTLNPWG